jgi:hypothetical protein
VKIYSKNREWAYVTFTSRTGARVRAVYYENKPKSHVQFAQGSMGEIFSEKQGVGLSEY